MERTKSRCLVITAFMMMIIINLSVAKVQARLETCQQRCAEECAHSEVAEVCNTICGKNCETPSPLTILITGNLAVQLPYAPSSNWVFIYNPFVCLLIRLHDLNQLKIVVYILLHMQKHWKVVWNHAPSTAKSLSFTP